MRASRRRTLATACWAVLMLMVGLGGCKGDLNSIETVLQRRSAALARLPEEDRGWKQYAAPESADDGAGQVAASGLLALEDARQIALRYNPDIHAARARIDQALARIGEARSAYFPTIALGHSSNRTFQTPSTRNRIPLALPTQQPVPNIPATLQDLDLSTLVGLLTTPLYGQSGFSAITRSFSEHTTSLSATWTLFDGLSREATVLAAKYAHGAARMSLAEAQRLLVRAVDGAYYQAQLGREQIRIARADVEFSERQLETAEMRLAAGKATEGDVLNFQVRLRAAQADERAAIGLHQNARTVLAELMGLDDAALPAETSLSPLAQEDEQDLAAPHVEDWVQRALAARPDLAQKEYEFKSKTEEVRAAKGQYSPRLVATGSYGFDRLSNMAYSADDQASAAAIEFRWQLFTGGLRTSRVRFTEAERWEIAAQLRRRRQQAASEVRQAATSLVNAQEQVRLQRLNLVSARENRRIVAAEYEAGKASLVRLNQAQRDLIETDAGLALARIRLRQAWTDLRAAAAVHPDVPQVHRTWATHPTADRS